MSAGARKTERECSFELTRSRSHSHSFSVPGAGIEPAQHCCHWCLRPARLPIPPSGRVGHAVMRLCSLAVCENRTFFYLFPFIFYLFSPAFPLLPPQSPPHHNRTHGKAHPECHAPQNNRGCQGALHRNCNRYLT